jgi:hypothetical protein
MKAKKPGKGTRAAVKGGSKVMASAHEMKKALTANFPR